MERNRALWDHYNAHGVLLLADFIRLTGGQYQTVMATFDTYGLESPPVHDSRREKYRRKAKRLRDEAARLGQEFLTIGQAAKMLNTKPNRIISIERAILRAGFSLPDIVMDEAKPVTPYQESRDFTEQAGKVNGTCNPLYYPSGLQVAKYWPGPGANETTYLLR